MLIAGREAAPELHVLHKCDTPACVNPDHLFIGTDADNVADMIRKGRMNAGTKVKGADHYLAKITDDVARKIFQDKRSHRKIAHAFGVNCGTVSHIKSKTQWRHATEGL
jgi:hypothetical protein